ncbi:general secretion pathway protein L [Mesorhizobium australicum]|uniref:General secretion pathway protein L n=2 Tax=Mesorhizobium australicum TaxID=536018 RepID=A0A1X7NUA6_9HYPH|nr:general secretion pathway protein L [Mesorhizobium australicum]
MALANFLSDLMSWWPDELGRAFGSRFRPQAPAIGATVRLVRAGAEISVDGTEPHLAAEPSQIAPLLDQLAGGRGRKPAVGIVIEPERYLKRSLAAIRLPRVRKMAMAQLDLQSATPFNPDDFFVLATRFDERVTDSSYYTVRKSALVPVVEGLRSGGWRVASILLSDGGELYPVDATSLREVVGVSAATRLGERAVSIGLATAAAGLVALVGAAHWRYSVAGAEVAEQVEAAESQVRELRAVLAARDAKIAQIGVVRDEKKDTVPVVRVIEEMSRAIPDNTWLTEISVSGDMVRFAGFSASAAALIPILEASPLFSAPTFMEPVVRVVNQEGERFSIAMKIENGDG